MKHLIGHVTGVCLETIDELEPLMEQIADECKLTVVSRAFHQFEPVGVTGVLVLSESLIFRCTPIRRITASILTFFVAQRRSILKRRDESFCGCSMRLTPNGRLYLENRCIFI
jgi:DNA-directed RNA polymerase specialized sigma54-like protein